MDKGDVLIGASLRNHLNRPVQRPCVLSGLFLVSIAHRSNFASSIQMPGLVLAWNADTRTSRIQSSAPSLARLISATFLGYSRSLVRNRPQKGCRMRAPRRLHPSVPPLQSTEAYQHISISASGLLSSSNAPFSAPTWPLETSRPLEHLTQHGRVASDLVRQRSTTHPQPQSPYHETCKLVMRRERGKVPTDGPRRKFFLPMGLFSLSSSFRDATVVYQINPHRRYRA